MYRTSSNHRYFDHVRFDSMVAAVRFARRWEKAAKTAIDVVRDMPKGRIHCVRLGRFA